jgi:hypothetical protein
MGTEEDGPVERVQESGSEPTGRTLDAFAINIFLLLAAIALCSLPIFVLLVFLLSTSKCLVARPAQSIGFYQFR